MPKPNFSGTWRFSREASVLQIPAPDETLFVVEHQEPRLSISRTHVVGDRRDTFSLELTTDGQDVSVERDNLRLRAHAVWDGDTLIFDAHLVRGGEAATNVVRYTLSNDRNRLSAEERFGSPSLSYDNFWVLDRVAV